MPDSPVKDSGQHEQYQTGARRDTSSGKGRFSFLPPNSTMALARHFEEGAKKYSDTECGPFDQNWRKGIKLSRFMDSAMRHMYKALDGREDEPHIIAAAWNLMCYYETLHLIKRGDLPAELDDMPHRGDTSEEPMPYV